MNKGDFKQLVRTLRNWKNEGIQITINTPNVDRREQGKGGKVSPEKNDSSRKEPDR
jgi:thymidine kinase